MKSIEFSYHVLCACMCIYGPFNMRLNSIYSAIDKYVLL